MSPEEYLRKSTTPQLLASQTITSDSTQFTSVTGISQNYRDLRVVVQGICDRSGSTGNIYLAVNSEPSKCSSAYDGAYGAGLGPNTLTTAAYRYAPDASRGATVGTAPGEQSTLAVAGEQYASVTLFNYAASTPTIGQVAWLTWPKTASEVTMVTHAAWLCTEAAAVTSVQITLQAVGADQLAWNTGSTLKIWGIP